MNALVVVLLVLLLLGAFGSFPAWSHSQDWGYMPSGGLGLVLVILLILFLLGYLR